MLRIRQVGIEGCDIVNNDIHGWLQALLQLRDVEHIMHTPKVYGSSKQYATFPSLAKMRNGPM
jgi:hypothetical protein